MGLGQGRLQDGIGLLTHVLIELEVYVLGPAVQAVPGFAKVHHAAVHDPHASAQVCEDPIYRRGPETLHQGRVAELVDVQ